MISPALSLIRRTWPAAHISLLVRDHLAEAMRANPEVDEVLPYERSGRHKPPLGTIRLARELAGQRYDLAILFPKSFESALLARLARIPHRVGWRTDARGWLLTHGKRLTKKDRRRHHMHQFLEVATFAGCSLPDQPEIAFHVSPEDRGGAAALLGVDGRNAPFLLAIHPGASKPPRSWHGDRFAEVADKVLGERTGMLVLLGGPADRPECSRIRTLAKCKSINLAGRTTIAQMAALIERCDLLLCNDSGPMHLAAALETPHVAVFGPGTPSLTAPLSDNAVSRPVTLALPCSPCRQDFFRECRPGPWGKPYCLEDLRVPAVTDAVSDLLRMVPDRPGRRSSSPDYS